MGHDDAIFWTRAEGRRVRIGLRASFVRDNAVAFVELLGPGTVLEDGRPFGLVQARVGREYELESPIGGRIVEVNAAVNVVDDPKLLNDDPEGRGWLIVVEGG